MSSQHLTLPPTFADGTSRNILVTGPSGAGKTYLSAMLRKQGLRTLDGDTVDGLSGWFDSHGQQIQYPLDAGDLFLKNHSFRWNRTRLQDLLERESGVYIFGSASNVFDMIDLFHQVFFLRASADVLTERLRNPMRDNPMGRTDFQLEYCLFRARLNEALARERGIPMLDATATPGEILLAMYSHIAK